MPSKVIFSILLSASVFLAFAQSEGHADYTALKKNPNYLKCTLVTLDKDSIPALMQNYREVYKRYGDKSGKITMILSTEGKKTLKARNIKGYELTLRNKKKQRFFSIDGVIVRVRYKGEKIKLFEREEMVMATFGLPESAVLVSSNVRKKYYVRKKYESYLTDVDDIAEPEILAEYFKECSGIAKKIEINRLKAKDIVAIVERYDNCE